MLLLLHFVPSCAQGKVVSSSPQMPIFQYLHALQTEQRRRTEAACKAAEAAAEAKQEADIAAYHARLRDKEAERQHHQASIGQDDQLAGIVAIVRQHCLLVCFVQSSLFLDQSTQICKPVNLAEQSLSGKG